MTDSTAIGDYSDVRELLSKNLPVKSFHHNDRNQQLELPPRLCLLTDTIAAIRPHLAQISTWINSCPARKVWEIIATPWSYLRAKKKKHAWDRQKHSWSWATEGRKQACLSIPRLLKAKHNIYSIQFNSTHIKVWDSFRTGQHFIRIWATTGLGSWDGEDNVLIHQYLKQWRHQCNWWALNWSLTLPLRPYLTSKVCTHDQESQINQREGLIQQSLKQR